MAPMRASIRRRVNLWGAAGCAGMMGFALFAQYRLHLEPCNMCMLQRIAVIALHNPRQTGARAYALLIGLVAASGVAVAWRHVWMQMQPPGSLSSCGADFYTMLDMMPFTEVVVRIWKGGGDCQAITWSMFGLSMPVWMLVGIASLGVVGVVANLRRDPEAIRFA